MAEEEKQKKPNAKFAAQSGHSVRVWCKTANAPH